MPRNEVVVSGTRILYFQTFLFAVVQIINVVLGYAVRTAVRRKNRDRGVFIRVHSRIVEFYGYDFSVGEINLLFEPPYRLVVVYAVYG